MKETQANSAQSDSGHYQKWRGNYGSLPESSASQVRAKSYLTLPHDTIAELTISTRGTSPAPNKATVKSPD